jgi:tRNA pseudouridine55 synthase
LRRTASGHLSIDRALTVAELEQLDEAALDARLLPADALVAEWPRVQLAADDAGRYLSGLRRRLPLPDAPQVRVYGPEPGAFLGTGHVAGGELIASRLLSPAEVGGLIAARKHVPESQIP